MFRKQLIGTTAADGTLTLTAALTERARLVKVNWYKGTLTTGVDAVIKSKGETGLAAALGVAPSTLDTTLLTLTNANANGEYWPAKNAIVDQEVSLAITGGGSTHVGGAVLYFDENVSDEPSYTLTPIAPFTLSNGDTLWLADPGDGLQVGIARALFQNVDTSTRTLTIKHGSTVFATVDIAAGGSFLFDPSNPRDYWVAAESTAINYVASAGSAIKLITGNSFIRAAGS